MPTFSVVFCHRSTAAILRRLTAALALVALLVPVGTASAGSRVLVHFGASTHAPKAGVHWTASVTARRGARALAGTVSLDVLYAGRVVRHVDSGRLSRGRWSKTVQWPDAAVGYPLNVRATVRSGRIVRRLFFAVRVHK